MAEELRAALVGGRIDKVYQPGRDEVVLAVRGSGGNGKLLLSASPNQPRAQFTTVSRENPGTPPMFCMLLRKHLTGGRILEIVQPPMERLLDFRLEVLDELGERSMAELWREALEQVPLGLDGPGRLALEELGEVLGRYDGDGQREALAHTRAELSRALEQAREAREKQGRMYQVLGITAGAFLVILLL